MRVVGFEEGEARLDWLTLTDALAAGHRLPRAEITDGFLYRGEDTLLNRAAWIDGLGLAVKTATIFPANTTVPSVNGGVCLYSDRDGTLRAVIDFHLVTKWKTAGDSLLAARRLARPDSRTILIVGAGTVARSMISAYSAAFPEARFLVWNRTGARAEALAGETGAEAVADLEAAVRRADIVSAATMSREPILEGAWLKPGTHVDLIGAYRPDMREADDEVLRRGRVFVDSRATVLGHIGELAIPIGKGTLAEADVIADYYDPPERFARETSHEITVFKNGGGAHLDLMTARHVLDRFD
ncbi:ornithine cyclodeaminase family protein [Palleronia sp. LCG004]|uniref:ornithine cyclodeaminase family protein n=1 Tax=Palleronia sp. LCG004 TaxID=3079304 RepID=UPI0029422577|nr:NAD(P)-binding domain-containing protein [Palleronia sp. LCG004]WOI55547.1 NAD(P)-binding domain-containing protein [Palleronia sp. LCG004]